MLAINSSQDFLKTATHFKTNPSYFKTILDTISNTQNISLNNQLTLALQTNANNIKITDLKSAHQWKQISQAHNNQLFFKKGSKAFQIPYTDKQTNKTKYIKLFDASQTNAISEGILPKKIPNYDKALQALLKSFNNQNQTNLAPNPAKTPQENLKSLLYKITKETNQPKEVQDLNYYILYAKFFDTSNIDIKAPNIQNLNNLYKSLSYIKKSTTQIDNKYNITNISNQTATYETIKKLTQEELKELTNLTIDEIITKDPSPILNSLGYELKAMQNNTSYRFTVRAEKTPSAYFKLSTDGNWYFKDFGNDEKGRTIIQFLQDFHNMDFKETIELSCSALNVVNKYQSATNQTTTFNYDEFIKNNEEQINKTKQLNQKLARDSQFETKVTNYTHASNSPQAIQYLKSRGITKIPPELYHIKGTISGTNDNGQSWTSHKEGVGVLTDYKDQDNPKEVGADIHYFKPIIKKDNTTQKTMTFKASNTTTIKSKAKTDFSTIIESKFDYAAAYQYDINNNNTDIYIANSTSEAKKVIQAINQSNNKNLIFLNQNDLPGIKFVLDIVDGTNTTDFICVKYDTLNEAKQDINDLTQNNINPKDRFIKADANYLYEQAKILHHQAKKENPSNVNADYTINKIKELSAKIEKKSNNQEYQEYNYKKNDLKSKDKTITKSQ